MPAESRNTSCSPNLGTIPAFAAVAVDYTGRNSTWKPSGGRYLCRVPLHQLFEAVTSPLHFRHRCALKGRTPLNTASGPHSTTRACSGKSQCVHCSLCSYVPATLSSCPRQLPGIGSRSGGDGGRLYWTWLKRMPVTLSRQSTLLFQVWVLG